jgi:hypothetical protein
MALTPELKVNLKPNSEKRERRKKSARELSDKFGAVTGSQTGTMGRMPNSQAPNALGMAGDIASIITLLSDKKLKNNIKTISNSMEILYG